MEAIIGWLLTRDLRTLEPRERGPETPDAGR